MSDGASARLETMRNLADLIGALSPAKRALLELRLAENGSDAPTRQTIPRRAASGSAPLSFTQQRLWFLNQLESKSPNYNQPKAVRLTGALDEEALQKALDRVVSRHEVLRTTFVAVDGSPVQVIAPNRSVGLPVVDLRALSDPDRDAETQRLLAEAIRRPFDLFQDLMLRTLLLRLTDQEHVLLLVTHHIASDGWSNGILWRELGLLYGAYSQGKPNLLPELPIQYADYAIWQRQWLQGERLEGQLSYWKERLAEAPTLLELPTDRPRPTVQSFRGARRAMRLTNELTLALREMSKRDGVTLFMTLLAAFKTLLFRYTRQHDILVGIPVANRSRPEVEQLIGFFVNNLVLRTDLSGNPTFQELLGRVREVALGAYAHQDLPFEKLVEELKPERNLSHTPLFQVMFGFQNTRPQPIELPGLTMSPMAVESGTAKFDLFLSMVEETDLLMGSLEYNTDLFDDATIARMLVHFETLLKAVAADSTRPLSKLNLLTDRERHQLLVEWNDTAGDYPADKCVHQLFEAQVKRTPDAVAVVFEDRQLTYSELDSRADQLAHYLRNLGVEPEVSVGLSMERSLDMVVALLGILKAGGAYVPLDPSYPKERLAFVMQDAGISVLLTQQRLRESLFEDGRSKIEDGDPRSSILDRHIKVAYLDTEWGVIARQSQVEPLGTVGPENRAYVIYTSGSTGKPKGVEALHRGVVNFLGSMGSQLGLTEKDILIAITTLSFDIAGLELFLPLCVGARVEIIGHEVATDGARLAEALARSGCTVMQATPTSWQMLLEAGWQGSKKMKILCGGEALHGALAAQLLAKSSSLWNMYGPTETTIWSAAHRLESAAGVIPIGRPIGNTEIYILDPYLNPAPVGVPGELYIGGVGVARGYRNCSDLVAEKFIPNLFSLRAGDRLYKTGDRARYLPDGNIEFLGRIDDQVKIRGCRIELGEIEAVLNQHPAITRAVVVDREIVGERCLVAYVMLKKGETTNHSDLRTFLRRQLPESMVPARFVKLEALPLALNGKLDRRALPAPDQYTVDLQPTFVPPCNPVEETVARIWAEVLKLKRVGIQDNFFELGGHSLLATRIISRVREAFKIDLSVRVLFQRSTIEELALVIEETLIEEIESLPETEPEHI